MRAFARDEARKEVAASARGYPAPAAIELGGKGSRPFVRFMFSPETTPAGLVNKDTGPFDGTNHAVHANAQERLDS